MADPQRTPIDRKEYFRQWRERNRDKVRQHQRAYRKRHPDRVRARAKAAYDRDGKGKEKARRWQQLNPEKVAASKKRYRQKPDTRGKERASDTLWRAANPHRLLLLTAGARARKLGIPCTISLADVVIPDVCPVLGVPFTKGEKKPVASSPTLDRIDNSKGYEPGNVMVICYLANTMKNAATFTELKRFCAFYASLLERAS